MCSFKIRNDNVHRVDRRMDVKQSTHVESIQVGVHVMCFATPNAPYWQISFHSPLGHTLTRICPWQNMGIVLCVRALTNFVKSDLFDALWRPPLQHALWIPSLLPELTIVTASSLDYQSTNWSRIQSVLNVAAWIVYGQARFQCITPTLHDRLHWMRIPQRIIFKQCLLVFKALHGLAPIYIKNYCVKVSSRRCLRLASHRRLVIPPPSKTVLFDEHSFTVGGPSLWNHLPDNVK